MSIQIILTSLFPDTAVRLDRGVSIGGFDLPEVVETYGTPFFVDDEATLLAKCHVATNALGDSVTFA